MFFRHLVGQWFSHWKGQATQDTCDDIRDSDLKTQNMVDKHTNHVQKIKDWNCDKSDKQITKKKLRDLWMAWRRVTLWQKTARKATQTNDQQMHSFYAKRALYKWSTRTALTTNCRDRVVKLRERQR